MLLRLIKFKWSMKNAGEISFVLSAREYIEFSRYFIAWSELGRIGNEVLKLRYFTYPPYLSDVAPWDCHLIRLVKIIYYILKVLKRNSLKLEEWKVRYSS